MGQVQKLCGGLFGALLRSPVPLAEHLHKCMGISHVSEAVSGVSQNLSHRLYSQLVPKLPTTLRSVDAAYSSGAGQNRLLLPLSPFQFPSNTILLRHASSVPRNLRPGNRFAPNPPTHQTLERYKPFKNRKPAIKSPAAHQWHFCNADYDPMQKLPENKLSYYAPPWARAKDYRAINFAQKPVQSGRNR